MGLQANETEIRPEGQELLSSHYVCTLFNQKDWRIIYKCHITVGCTYSLNTYFRIENKKITVILSTFIETEFIFIRS